MTDLYTSLVDTRVHHLGPDKWSGNQRWYAVEHDAPLDYTFRTAALSEEEGDVDSDEQEMGTSPSLGRQTLFHLTHLSAPPLQQCSYFPDGVHTQLTPGSYRQHFPWDSYGVIMCWEALAAPLTVRVAYHRRDSESPSAIIVPCEDGTGWSVQNGLYTLVFRMVGIDGISHDADGSLLSLRQSSACLTVAFHLEAMHAHEEAQDLLIHADAYRQRSADFWNAYLCSCPVYDPQEDVRYKGSNAHQEIVFSRETIVLRQLWHWWAALINVADVSFQPGTPYLAPDRSLWYGSWSNDSPEALCALVVTNQHRLARACIVRYVQQAINDEGDLGWYTHAYGRSCLHHAHDSGAYSHGVPTIVHTVEFYVRHTGDATLLEEPAGNGFNVWEKLKRYMTRVFTVRDSNADGLIEWRNLWETGWDNKVAPFFSQASIDEWIEVISRGDAEQVRVWYAEKAVPVTTLGEQVHFLTALRSMERLARMQHDDDVAAFCQQHSSQICRVLEQRHWDRASNFYYDWDVQRSQRCNEKHLDAFYCLYYLKDSERTASMVEQYSNPEHFGLRYPPTLDVSASAFDPEGYWRGSYWPREVLYVGLALLRQGYVDLARREVLKALCSQDGCIIAEHLNPFSGQRLGTCKTMAYAACLNIVLQEIVTGQALWL